MNGGNESSGADRAGGPVATSVPIGWQRCVREGAVLYIRYDSPKFPSFYPQALQLPEFSPIPPLKAQIAGALFLFSVPPPSSAFLLSLSLALCISSLCLFLTLPFLGRSLTNELFFKSLSQFSVN